MKFKLALITGLSILIISGCEFLEDDQSTGEPREYYYSYFGTYESLLNYGYVHVYQDFGVVDGAMLDCATDDAEYAYSNALVQSFNNGSWSAFKTIDDRWDVSYTVIRSLNDYIANFDPSDLERFQYNQGYEEDLAEIQYYPYEARALRAYHFFELAKRYGDIPMPTSPLTVDEANSVSETPFESVISFVVSELDAVMNSLPDDWDVSGLNRQTGRMTKGVCMALKSRALLYAASPLHNPGGDNQKWIDAAEAANDLIEEGLYSLEDIGATLANEISDNTTEIIWTKRNDQDNTFERLNFPIGYEGGATGVCPTQNLVDAFQTINGYDVTLTSGGWVCSDPAFDSQHPYDNRDPRLYKTLLYDSATWKDRAVEIYQGGLDAPPIDGATLTGYYLKKYLVESTDLTPSINSKFRHHWIIFRYAEILMNYAEAMNEAYGPEALGGSFTMTALEALNMIRTRANMPAIASGLTKDQFREALIREKRVEFAFEGHRFWDVRRWQIGGTTQTSIQGVDIERSGQTRTFELKTVESRVWNDRMNLFPIPQQEVYINSNLSQNTGW